MRVSIVILTVTLLAVGIRAQEECPKENTCPYENVALLKTGRVGDSDHYYIGGLFGVHDGGKLTDECNNPESKIRKRGIMNMQAFLWAVNYYKSKLGVTSVDIGAVAFDSCGLKEQTIENVLSFAQCKLRPEGVKRRNLVAYVGPDRSGEALGLGSLMNELGVTYISHAATSPELSDSSRIPYFMRTVPSDIYDTKVMKIVLEKIQMKYIIIVYMDDAYGRAGMMRLTKEAESISVCVVKAIKLPVQPTPAELTAVMTELNLYKVVRYVALYTDAAHAKLVLERVEDNKFVFIGTSSWGRSKEVIGGVAVETAAVNNSIVMEPAVYPDYNAAMTDFKAYWENLNPTNLNDIGTINPWFDRYWEQKFGCSLTLKNCDDTNNLIGDEIDVYVPNVLMAVKAITDGIKAAAEAGCNGVYTLCTNLLNNENRGTQIYESIKQATSDDRKPVFDVTKVDDKFVNSDVSSNLVQYNVYRIVNKQYVMYATYSGATGVFQEANLLNSRFYEPGICPRQPCLECNELPPTLPPTTQPPTTMKVEQTTVNRTDMALVYYPANQHITGAYAKQMRTANDFKTRFEIGQKWIIALGVLAGLGIFAVIIFEIYVMFKLLGTHNSHKWRTVWLGQLLLFGVFLSYLTLFAYISIPTEATCGITRFGIGFSYSIMFSVLLVKLMVILTSKASESLLPGDMESPNYLKGIYQFLMFVFAVGVQVVIGIQWLITVPPGAIQVMDNRGEPYWICNHYTWSASSGWYDMQGFVRTNFENHVLSLVYIMVLILITTILALKAHGIITNNRESVFIGISAGFSIPIWLAWTLVGGLNRQHEYSHEFGDCSMAIGLFLTATLILFAMFLPKIRQLVNMGVEGIYFEDDRDTVYNESVILAPPSYKSRPGSVIYVNNPGLYSEPMSLHNGDATHNHLRYSTAGSVYSSPPGMYRKAESTIGPSSKVLRVTGDLTGKHPAERKRPQSDYGYGGRSVKGTLSRSRSHQNIGAL